MKKAPLSICNGRHSHSLRRSASRPNGLPADSVFELNLTGSVVPASFAAAAHLAPGLRDLSVYIDDLGAEAPSVIAELTALQRLSLVGHSDPEDGLSLRLNDHALAVIADLPALEALSLLGGSYTEHGLQQLSRLPRLRHLHIERDGPQRRMTVSAPSAQTQSTPAKSRN